MKVVASPGWFWGRSERRTAVSSANLRVGAQTAARTISARRFSERLRLRNATRSGAAPSRSVNLQLRQSPTRAQVLGEFVRERAGADGVHRAGQVVLHADELGAAAGGVHVQQHVAGARVAVLGAAHGAGVDVADAVHLARPR